MISYLGHLSLYDSQNHSYDSQNRVFWAYPRLCPVVKRTEIVKDSEVLYDYGFHYWESAKVDVIGEESD